MKELTEEIIIKALRHAPQDALIFLLRKFAIGCCGNHVLGNIELIDLANNDLQTTKRLFEQFPIGWWFNLSGNTMIDKFNEPVPLSLGLLDLSGTQIQSLDCFSSLSDSLIFRLNLDLRTVKEGNITRKQLFQILPKIWVLNNDFVKYEELIKVNNICDDESETEIIHNDFFTSIPTGNINTTTKNFYNTKIPTIREQDVIEILTKLIPSKKLLSEFYRLDVVVDDYLQQAHIFNNHPEVVRGFYKRIPTFSCNKLLLIPHRIRLDMSALLTAAVLFPMPKSLFRETMENLLIAYMTQDEIHELSDLPHFVKTGIISLSRRISEKERQEYELNGYLSIKPSPPSSLSSSPGGDILNPPPTQTMKVSLPLRDANGFRFLSFLRKYLGSPIERSLQADPSSAPFTEMEIDLLHYLPDIPTIASCPPPSSAAYRDWVSLAARHSVILMSRSPNCPSLTKPQTSTAHETVLKQLRPLLVAAGMTYEDLEISTTGPGIDGRTSQSTQVLSFGAGVPNGQASSLIWNANGASRDYQRPWIPTPKPPPSADNIPGTSLHQEAQASPENDEIASIGDSFFSSNNSDAGVDGELTYPPESKHVIRAEVRNRSKTGDSADSETSFKSRDKRLQKKESYESSASISELARGLSLDVGLGLKPWESRSHHEPGHESPKRISGYSADHLNIPSFTLGSPSCISSDVPWKSISEAPVLLHPLSKSPYTVSENKYTLGISGTTNTLSPILEDKSPSSHDIRPLDLTAINLHQNHPPLAASTTTTARGILNKRDSFQATARSFNQSGRRSSIERTESTSSIGSWKSISRCNSGMISRCDSTNSINNDPQLLQQLPLRERKFRKQQKILLNKARAENQQWYSGFNTNLGESIQAGPDKMNIKEFFLEFDAKKDKLLAQALSSKDSQDIDFTYSDSNPGSLSDSILYDGDQSLHTYQGRSTGDLKEDLLRDMGTTRNIHQLQAVNQKNKKVLKEQKRLEEARRSKRGKILNSPCSILTHSSDMKQLPTLPKLSWAAFGKSTKMEEPIIKQQEVFLTESDFSVAMSSSMSQDDDKLQAVSEHDHESPEQLSPKPPSPNTRVEWDSTLPLAQQLRQTLKYDHVYPSSPVEWGSTGPAGQISSSWYQYPDKVVYILDPNTPLDILRNEMMTKTTPSPSKAQEPPSSSSSSSANIKIPLQPRVYQNKYLTPSLPIYYETIPNQRFYVHPRQHEANPTTEWKSEENSNSVTTFTVNLSPNHSIHEEYPADIDLESIEEKRKLSSAAGGGGGGKRQEVDEIPKTEDGHDAADPSYTRGNTPLITLTPAHGRTPSVNTLEKLLGNLPEEVKYQLPPVTTPATRIRDSLARCKQMVVQVDPAETPLRSSMINDHREKVSVFKPATTKLKLNSSFKQTIPRGYFHGSSHR